MPNGPARRGRSSGGTALPSFCQSSPPSSVRFWKRPNISKYLGPSGGVYRRSMRAEPGGQSVLAPGLPGVRNARLLVVLQLAVSLLENPDRYPLPIGVEVGSRARIRRSLALRQADGGAALLAHLFERRRLRRHLVGAPDDPPLAPVLERRRDLADG